MGAAILPSVCVRMTGRGLLSGPCFYAEFPVVRGAESGKERSYPGNPWNPHWECSKIKRTMPNLPRVLCDRFGQD